jgi:hypothetical protein
MLISCTPASLVWKMAQAFPRPETKHDNCSTSGNTRTSVPNMLLDILNISLYLGSMNFYWPATTLFRHSTCTFKLSKHFISSTLMLFVTHLWGLTHLTAFGVHEPWLIILTGKYIFKLSKYFISTTLILFVAHDQNKAASPAEVGDLMSSTSMMY